MWSSQGVQYAAMPTCHVRPLFFNIDFTDHLFEYDDYEARYVDYTTPYFCVDDIPSVATLVQPRAIEFFLVYQYQ